MCEDGIGAMGRRSFLRLLAPGRQVPAGAGVVLPGGLEVLPRSAWASGLSDPGPLPTEAPDDVRVLIVHHSVSSNTYAEDAVVGLLRDFHALHTGPDREWPDVAYNFFVDRFGRAWEGRSGSLDGPVIGDATGGNQGFSQLVCLVGDFRHEPPSDAAQQTLVALLAHIAERDGVDPAPGATASFVSRGSNRHPGGTTVSTPTIAGHRDMSVTACPGDAAYALVTGDLPARVAGTSATTSTTAPDPTTATTTTTAPSTSSTAGTTTRPRPVEPSDGAWPAVAVFGAAGTAVVAGVGAVIARRSRLMRARGRHSR